MKKLILIFGLFGMILNSYGQRDTWADTFSLASIIGTDTVLYKTTEDTDGGYRPGFGGYWSLEVNFKGLSASGAIIQPGCSNYGDTFNSLADAFTLNLSDSASVNGTQKATVLFDDIQHRAKYNALKITPGAITGNLIFKYIQQ